jgi:hypothetical protein
MIRVLRENKSSVQQKGKQNSYKSEEYRGDSPYETSAASISTRDHSVAKHYRKYYKPESRGENHQFPIVPLADRLEVCPCVFRAQQHSFLIRSLRPRIVLQISPWRATMEERSEQPPPGKCTAGAGTVVLALPSSLCCLVRA